MMEMEIKKPWAVQPAEVLRKTAKPSDLFDSILHQH
jgi:hypothetical protein